MPCSHPILGVLPLPGNGTPLSNSRTPTMSPIPGGNQFLTSVTLPTHFSPLPPPATPNLPAKLPSIISSESSGFIKVWKSFDVRQCLHSAPAKNTPEAWNCKEPGQEPETGRGRDPARTTQMKISTKGFPICTCSQQIMTSTSQQRTV